MILSYTLVDAILYLYHWYFPRFFCYNALHFCDAILLLYISLYSSMCYYNHYHYYTVASVVFKNSFKKRKKSKCVYSNDWKYAMAVLMYKHSPSGRSINVSMISFTTYCHFFF